MTLKQALSSADAINRHFINSVSAITTQTLSKIARSNVNNYLNAFSPFTFCVISRADVRKTVQQLPTNKSNRADNISALMIKKSGSAIANVLTEQFNRSLSTNVFYENLKKVLVYPLHKKGELGELSNYRPNAVLPAFAKLFEKLVQEQMNSFLDANESISPKQHGFRKGKSC